MHAHRDAFNFLVYGRKRWFVYRPSDARYGSSPTLEWFRAKDGYKEAKRSNKLLECVQQPGDAMFMPQGWAHSVINIDTSIGVALEVREKQWGDAFRSLRRE